MAGTGLCCSFDRPTPYLSGLSPQGPITLDGHRQSLCRNHPRRRLLTAVLSFKLTGQGGFFWKETVLHDFACEADGFYPIGATFGPDGSLYGVTPDWRGPREFALRVRHRL